MKVSRVFESSRAEYIHNGKYSGPGWWFYAEHRGRLGAGKTAAEAIVNLRHDWNCLLGCRRHIWRAK